eukprot:GHVO01046300.1.p1 GENE.GHVO01046300.1~~GHVO01046300.1.p1  ORF type:complete len:659 (-),score=21.19 GHVO01046300.1:832-2808(-)
MRVTAAAVVHICGRIATSGHIKAVCRAQKNGFNLHVRTQPTSRDDQDRAELERCQRRCEELTKRLHYKYPNKTKPDDNLPMDTNAISTDSKMRTVGIVPALIGKCRAFVTLDSGAGMSVLSADEFHRIRKTDSDFILQPTTIQASGADGKLLNILGVVDTTLTIGPETVHTAFLITACDDGPKILISLDDIVALQATVGDCLRFYVDSEKPDNPQIQNIETLPLTLQEAIEKLHPKDKLGKCCTDFHSLELTSPRPIYSKLRPLSPVQREAIESQISTMLELGVARVSQSPYASPVTLAAKKDGSLRFCVDYRRLNSITVPDRYPMPRIDELIDSIGNSRYFTALDLRSGFWQIPMLPEDIPKTAFITHQGLYEFTVMPFGMINAPATFQRTMDRVLRDLRYLGVLVYMDDVLIHTRKQADHGDLLLKVLHRLSEAGLYINHKKCSFMKDSIAYLGHVIDQQGIRPDPDKVKALHNLIPPTDVSSLRRHLGLLGYYRQFIPHYAEIAKPIHNLLEARRQQLVKSLSDDTLLHRPLPGHPFILDCDASNAGIGLALTQLIEGIEQPISFAARTFSETESRWSTCEQEAFAVVWGVDKFRRYLLPAPFLVRTDHWSLQWIRTAKSPKIARWASLLAEYEFTVQHRSGWNMSTVYPETQIH